MNCLLAKKKGEFSIVVGSITWREGDKGGKGRGEHRGLAVAHHPGRKKRKRRTLPSSSKERKREESSFHPFGGSRGEREY